MLSRQANRFRLVYREHWKDKKDISALVAPFKTKDERLEWLGEMQKRRPDASSEKTKQSLRTASRWLQRPTLAPSHSGFPLLGGLGQMFCIVGGTSAVRS
jgi:hypothetical protein